MKNLGKIVFIIFTFMFTTLYADVRAYVEPKVVYRGESAYYNLKVSGGAINKPIINTICGSNVIGTRSQTSIEMINGDYKKSYVLSYEFTPTKDCVIEPVEVEINGKVEKSNAVKVVIKNPSQQKDAPFLLSLKPSKESLFVGEPFELTLTLKQRKDAEVVDSKFLKPDFQGFWVKGESQASRTDDGEYIVTTAKYKLAPQREGNLTISPAQIKIATRANRRDMWGSFMPQIKWRSYFSNEVKIEAKPLPNNAKYVGDFSIKAYADKTKINSNEAVNVTVEVVGDGNLEDIESFKPFIAGVNVFEEKVQVKGNKLTQKLAFVADNNFTIPPFKLAFYNLKTKKVEQIQTKPIHITVTGVAKHDSNNLKIARERSNQSTQEKSQVAVASQSVNFLYIVFAFVVGLILGVSLMLVKSFKLSAGEKKFNIKDEKLLLIKLLPYKDENQDVKKLVDILEKNIYSNEKEKLDKNLIKEIVKRYNIT
ncbi:BatD family protein [Sulfurimonas sp.]